MAHPVEYQNLLGFDGSKLGSKFENSSMKYWFSTISVNFSFQPLLKQCTLGFKFWISSNVTYSINKLVTKINYIQ